MILPCTGQLFVIPSGHNKGRQGIVTKVRDNGDIEAVLEIVPGRDLLSIAPDRLYIHAEHWPKYATGLAP